MIGRRKLNLFGITLSTYQIVSYPKNDNEENKLLKLSEARLGA